MNSRETGCLGVAAALALSALASDAAAEEAAVAHTPASPTARPRSVQPTHTKPTARAQTSATRPQLSRTLSAPGTFDAGLAPLMPALTPIVPVASGSTAPLPGVDLPDSELREQHIREAPEAPAPGSAPVRPTEDETPPRATTGDEAALEVAERLLGNGVPLQLLQSVIVPAARGVTIAEIQTENVGAVTLSVRPTKITRGSGLVAVGRF